MVKTLAVLSPAVSPITPVPLWAGATVDVVGNLATSITLSLRTNESGNFNAPYLTPGLYRITTTSQGFKRASQENVQVRIGETSEVNLQLQVGDVTEEVRSPPKRRCSPPPKPASARWSTSAACWNCRCSPATPWSSRLAPGTINGTDMRLRKAPSTARLRSSPPMAADSTTTNSTSTALPTPYSDGIAPACRLLAAADLHQRVQDADVRLSMRPCGHTMGSVVNINIKGGTNQLHGRHA